MPEFDEIQKAKHYNTDESGVECIDVIKYMSLPRGNAMKYIWRAGKKDSTPEGEIKDLEKAIYYLQKEIEVIKKRHITPYIGVAPDVRGGFVLAIKDGTVLDIDPRNADASTIQNDTSCALGNKVCFCQTTKETKND